MSEGPENPPAVASSGVSTTRRPERPPGRQAWDATLPPVRSLSLRLYLIAVFLMPLQLEIDAFDAVAGTRLPPGDIFLALAILAAPASLRLRRDPVSMLPLAMMATLAWGLLVAMFYAGEASDHAIRVKFVGAIVLAVWCLVTVAHAKAGHGPRILRVWLIGMAFWAVIAYIDWKYVDFLSFVSAKTPSRFGGMQYDPNNAGVAFAVALLLVWKYGHRVFPSRVMHLTVGVILAVALTQTFSRTGYLGLLGGIAVVLAIETAGVRKWARYLAAGAIVLAAALATGIISDSTSEWDRRPDTVSSRDQLSAAGMEAFTESSGLGIGLGTHKERSDQIIHSTGVWLLVEMSLVGVLFFFAMIAIPFHAALRLRRFDSDFALALIGAQVVMAVASNGIEAVYQRQWWLVIGLSAAVVATAARDVDRVDHSGAVGRKARSF